MKVCKNLVDKRKEEIMRIIQENNFVSVNELVERFGVSAATIRRDLQYWESVGAIERNYGGALLLQAFVDEDVDSYIRSRYMKAIAHKAASFVEDGDVIFMNSSTTAIMMIEFIKRKHVTIITNNARVIRYIPNQNVTVLLMGGEIRFPKKSLTGEIAINSLNKITANKCFVGCSGLTTEGISTANVKEATVNKTILQRTAGKKYVLCDHTKVGLNFAFTYSGFNTLDCIITDVEANSEIIENIKRNNKKLEIYKVEPLQKGIELEI